MRKQMSWRQEAMRTEHISAISPFTSELWKKELNALVGYVSHMLVQIEESKDGGEQCRRQEITLPCSDKKRINNQGQSRAMMWVE